MMLLALQQDTFLHSRTDRYKTQSTNAYRDALDLAGELREQFGAEVEQMPADEIKELVERQGSGVGIDTSDMVPARHQESKAAKTRRRVGPKAGRGVLGMWRSRSDGERSRQSSAPTKEGLVGEDEIELRSADTD